MPDEGENIHAGHRQRLRQRYLKQGLEGFEPHEALELLLFYAIARRDTNLLAHRLLKRFGTLDGVLSARPEDLAQVEGVGEQTATLLSLMKPLLNLASRSKEGRLPQVKTNEQLETYCLSLSFAPEKETFYLLCLDAQWRVLRAVPLFTGTIDRVDVHSRVILETALRYRAYYVIAVHNHPSEIAAPSQADLNLTEEIKTALDAVDIPLVDHAIVANGHVFSLRRWTELEQAKRQIERDWEQAADKGAKPRRNASALKDALSIFDGKGSD